jgi:hypothetical protein
LAAFVYILDTLALVRIHWHLVNMGLFAQAATSHCFSLTWWRLKLWLQNGCLFILSLQY